MPSGLSPRVYEIIGEDAGRRVNQFDVIAAHRKSAFAPACALSSSNSGAHRGLFPYHGAGMSVFDLALSPGILRSGAGKYRRSIRRHSLFQRHFARASIIDLGSARGSF